MIGSIIRQTSSSLSNSSQNKLANHGGEEQTENQKGQSMDLEIPPSNFNSSLESDWINLCSEHEDSADQKNKELKQIENYCLIPIFPKCNSPINLCTGLFITDDGVIRYTSYLDSVSFGFQQQQVSKVEEKKRLNVVNLQYSRDRYFSNNTVDEAVRFLYHANHVQYQQISQALYSMQKIHEEEECFKERNFDFQFFEEKEIELKVFTQMSFEYLEKYVNSNPNSMFKYTIERFNHQVQDHEIPHTGYSKSYLELIGLDSDSLVQLNQRHKKIDLMVNKLNISEQSIQCLQSLENQNYPTNEFVTQIVTFDGFPLKLYQKHTVVNLGFKSLAKYGVDWEYSLVLTEIDVDVYELQQLIMYRKKLMNSHHQHLKIEDLIRVELSYLFEDVEYSVLSQNFIEKYYSNNLENLDKLKENSKCRYKYIQ